MMVWISLIIILAWSFNRLTGRNDCLDTDLVSRIDVIGDEEVSSVSLCSEASAYDFKVDKFSESISQLNEKLKTFWLPIEPVKVIWDMAQPYAYSVDKKTITLGKALIATHLSRALVEVKYGDVLPDHLSREIYIDWLALFHGAKSSLNPSFHLVHYMTKDYCGQRPVVWQHLKPCLERKEFSPSGYGSTLKFRAPLLAVWRLFYQGIEVEERHRMIAELSKPLAALPPLHLTSTPDFEVSLRNMFNQGADGLLAPELREKFKTFHNRAMRTQIRGGALVVDFVLQGFSDHAASVRKQFLEVVRNALGVSLLFFDGSYRSPISVNPADGLREHRVRYWLLCLSGSNQKIEPVQAARRLVVVPECQNQKPDWAKLLSGDYESFLRENSDMPFVQFSSLEESIQLEFHGGKAEESSIFGAKIEELTWNSQVEAFQVGGKSAPVEFFRPVREKVRLQINLRQPSSSE